MIRIDNLFDIPTIYQQSEGREEIADQQRTPGGRLRRDVVAVKATVEIRTRPIKLATRDALLAHLDGKLWGFVDVWCDTWPESKVLQMKPNLTACERSLDVPGRWELGLRFEEA